MDSSVTSSRNEDECVRVALRIRPQLAKERIDMCQVCTSVVPNEPQVSIKDRSFTYDYVFDMPTGQAEVYDTAVRSLINGCFEGYNATVIAYGQTGSGKTYTMGTAFDIDLPLHEVGIIPRAVEHLFNGISERLEAAKEGNLPLPDFKVTAQFMELYNEDILDLGDLDRDIDSKKHKSHIRIHEDACGGIYVVGVTTHPVYSLEETIKCLKTGALSRSTASTNMNVQSSRSHAIFTLHIKQSRLVTNQSSSGESPENEKEVDSTHESAEFEVLTAKFHFVDLAGSERLKRTGATGERQKEGIAINSGLLALGNVISALGDQTKKGSHVPYRDSKLTRLLQDSLGGNSRTLMIACVSPSDRDFMETLNTFKYANRARNIKNQVVVNQDKASRQLAELRRQVIVLQQELNDYKTGRQLVNEDGVEYVNDMFHENTMLQKQNDDLRSRLKTMHEALESIKTRNSQLVAQNDLLHASNGKELNNEIVEQLVNGYLKDMEDLRAKLLESDAICESLRRSPLRSPSRPSTQHSMMAVSMTSSFMDMPLSPPPVNIGNLIKEAKRDVERMKKKSRLTEEDPEAGISEATGNISEEDENQHNEHEDDDPENLEENDEDSHNDMSDSEDDDELNTDAMHEDLATLSSEISIKQKLIDELAQSQKRLQSLKQQYEDKLHQLQDKIKDIESERDSVLSNLSKMESNSADKTKKVKEDYEKKLTELQKEVKKMNVAKKEHAKQMKNQAGYERQMKTMQKDLQDMKNTKVKLMRKIKEDAEKLRQSEKQRSKEVAQMKKENTMKQNKIKTLEADQRKKEVVLKRRLEEVEALRKQNKPMSSKTAGRVGTYSKQLTVPVAPIKGFKRNVQAFSPKVAKNKWDGIEKSVAFTINKKQTITHMERDMENWIKNRDKLKKKVDRIITRRNTAVTEDEITEHDDLIDSVKREMTLTQENIDECQMNIIQMEETRVVF